MSATPVEAMSPLQFHLLLALASGPMYGYAIREAIVAESEGSLTPRAGSLYRIIGRMIADGFVHEVDPPSGVEPHPGLERKYYTLTGHGRRALATEAQRLKASAAMAAKRLGVVTRRS